jgi:hypothetical protein
MKQETLPKPLPNPEGLGRGSSQKSKNKKESSSCSEGVCPVDEGYKIVWGVNYFKY